MGKWVDEVYTGSRFGLRVTGVLHDTCSPFQRVRIVQTDTFGKALLLDDFWMLSERDEFVYHEMLVHPAMVTASRVENVLIIGGGDGGSAREVLKHPGVKHVDLVEIDRIVVEVCQQHLPAMGAWGDPRLHVQYADGAVFVRDTEKKYDVIIIDGADPVGPAAVLFSPGFFQMCAEKLTRGGVFSLQLGSPLLQTEEHVTAKRSLADIFPFVSTRYATVMLYPGGMWGWCTCYLRKHRLDLQRIRKAESSCRYFNHEIHFGAKATPTFLR